MSLFSKVNVSLVLISMVFALAPTATYAAAYIKFDGIGGKIPRMRVTDKTTVHEVAVFAARHVGVDVGCISLSWMGGKYSGATAAEQYGQTTSGMHLPRTEGQRKTAVQHPGYNSVLMTHNFSKKRANSWIAENACKI